MNLQRHAKTKRASNLLCDENTTRPAAKKTMTVVDSENDGKVPTNISRWYGETRDTSQVKIRRLYWGHEGTRNQVAQLIFKEKNHHFCKQKVSVPEYNSWPRCSFSNRKNLSCSSLGPSSAFFPNKMPGTPILKLQPKTSRPTFQISMYRSCQRKSDTISKNCCTSLPSQ